MLNFKVNNFKSIIQVKRHINIEPIQAPEIIEDKLVKEPPIIDVYLKSKLKIQKTHKKKIKKEKA